MTSMSFNDVPIPVGVSRLIADVYTRAPRHRAERVEHAITSLFTHALRRLPDDSVFVLTGDIPAMWLRDSTWQLRPLLAAASESETYSVLAAVSRRQAACVLIDPYANAFNPEPNSACWHKDFPDQSPWVFERKYELDSLAAFLDFALRLHTASGRTDHLDAQFCAAASAAVNVIATEQRHNPSSYKFLRTGGADHDHLSHDGFGAPVRFTGMSWSGFRPSDDACTYGYLVPANAHTAVALRQVADLPESIALRHELRTQCRQLATEITNGIAEHAITSGDEASRYAYEVDGLGNALHMDDANVPSLLSLPYLGWCASDDPVYLATRQWVLSPKNPWFASGSAAAGVGSPHTPALHVWPIAVAMAGLTAVDASAMDDALLTLESTDAGTGRMHESFHCDDPTNFTRAWFSWADMTYVHLVLRSVGLAFD